MRQIPATAAGGTSGIEGIVKNAFAGTGWEDAEGTGSGTVIPASKTGQELLSYKKVVFREPADTTPVGSVHTVKGSKYVVTSAGAVSLVKAKSVKTFTLPANVRIKGKTFSVTGIKAAM